MTPIIGVIEAASIPHGYPPLRLGRNLTVYFLDVALFMYGLAVVISLGRF